MITLHTWTTPNGRKPAILLAELGLDYTLHRVDIGKKENKQPDFLALNPNGKIPALTDGDIRLFESGAILLHLADKTKRFISQDGQSRAEVLSWLFWQIGGPGPMFGQVEYFGHGEHENAEAKKRFLDEGRRLAGVLDKNLAKREWVAGEYSIADIANYPWFAGAQERMPELLEGSSNVQKWLDRMGKRPAVQRGMNLEK